MNATSGGHAAITQYNNFKRQNTIDSATIKENTARISAATRAAAAGTVISAASTAPSAAAPAAGGDSKAGTPAAKPVKAPTRVSSATARTIGPSGLRRSTHSYDAKVSAAATAAAAATTTDAEAKTLSVADKETPR